MVVPLEWKLSISGHDQVKSSLDEINSRVRAGTLTERDAQKEKKALAGTIRNVTYEQNL